MYSHGPEWPKQIHFSLFDYHAEFARKAFSLCNTEKEMKKKNKGQIKKTGSVLTCQWFVQLAEF